MSYGGQTNLAYVDDEAARKRAAKDVEASGQFYEQLDAGQLKLTQPGPEEKHKSAIKTQELQKGEGVKFQEHSYFWTSRLCQVISVVILAVLIGFIVAWCVCMYGHCSSDPCDMDCSSSYWGYEDYNGPDCWSSCYATCGGSEQSPIDLDDKADLISGMNDDLSLDNYSIPATLLVSNNGHSLQGSTQVGLYGFTGIGLVDQYITDQFHLHWGGDSSQGSEHTIGGKSYPMEMHIVHHNTNKYKDFDDALGKEDGVAVLGFFFIISETDNEALDPILDVLDNVQFKDETFQLANFTLGSILPEGGIGNYYRYQGSLTTPGCTENITWTVFEGEDSSVKISEKQMDILRNSLYEGKDKNSKLIVNNYRTIQDINDRHPEYHKHQVPDL